MKATLSDLTRPLRCIHSNARLTTRVSMHASRNARSSSISSDEPVARSEGMHPSTQLSTNTERHSWPLAEWMVVRIR